MGFKLPEYHPPDFSVPPFTDSPLARFEVLEEEGVALEGYHATSIYPEYFHVEKGEWRLIEESRMDCVVVLDKEGALRVKPFRHLRVGEHVACGRLENGEEGIYVHTKGFDDCDRSEDKFQFRTRLTRETSFSIDYDELYDLLAYEREEGFVLWVLGPAVVFDRDARGAFVRLVQDGYVHGLLAGNALAVHDTEAALYGTALGQEIYSKRTQTLGHYRHLDTINRIRSHGSIGTAVASGLIPDGIMRELTVKSIPYVLAGSIRDDGPLPDVITDAALAQDRMRNLAKKATTVIALATQLHAIATGNMVPSYKVVGATQVRPVYFYTVDMSEFAVDKLANRGSLTAKSILTNVQDFVVTLERGLGRRCVS